MTGTVPALEEAKQFALDAFANLSDRDAKVRFELCEKVERAVLATVDDEDTGILRASAYLQEVGVIHSSKEKAARSLEMCEGAFGQLHPVLEDCILNHVRAGVATSREGRLMQICHKYVTTHFLDYMELKSRISEFDFERLQMERIEAYSEYLQWHPRGSKVSYALYQMFYPPPS